VTVQNWKACVRESVPWVRIPPRPLGKAKPHTVSGLCGVSTFCASHGRVCADAASVHTRRAHIRDLDSQRVAGRGRHHRMLSGVFDVRVARQRRHAHDLPRFRVEQDDVATLHVQRVEAVLFEYDVQDLGRVHLACLRVDDGPRCVGESRPRTVPEVYLTCG